MPTLTFKVKHLQNQLKEYGVTMQMVAEESGFSRETCSKVINGWYQNPEVVEAAIRVRDRRKEELAKMVKKVNSKITGK